MVRINYANGYLHCNVSDNSSEYLDLYDSSEECFADIKQDILDECAKRNYNKEETQAVLDHYEIKLNNAAGTWENQY